MRRNPATVRYGARRRIGDSCSSSGSAVSGWIWPSPISGADGSGSADLSANFLGGHSAEALLVGLGGMGLHDRLRGSGLGRGQHGELKVLGELGDAIAR